MTISILVGIIFLLGSIFILSSGLSSAMRMRTQVGRYPLVKAVIGFISLIILISVTFKEHWYAELWRVVVFVAFIFALLQVISTIFTIGKLKNYNHVILIEFLSQRMFILTIRLP